MRQTSDVPSETTPTPDMIRLRAILDHLLENLPVLLDLESTSPISDNQKFRLDPYFCHNLY